MAKFEGFFNREKTVVEADSLWDAKQKVIKHFKVSKKNEGLVAIQSLKSKQNQDFRYL
jgi:hypothetical protein